MGMLNYYSNRIKWRLLMPFLRARHIDIKNSIIIFSEPRGGSTWLMEILSRLPKTAAIFEPFHSHYGALESYTWGNHKKTTDTWSEGKDAIVDILNVNHLDSYQLERSPWYEYLSAEKFVFKSVMGTPIMPWIIENFEFKFKPIYILRHPLSVASSTIENLYMRGSTINVDHKWEPTGYNKVLFKKHQDLFDKNADLIDTLIARWCINNHYALQQNQKWIPIHYEHMLLQPKQTLEDIFKEWNIELPAEIQNNLDQPSHSDFKKDFRKDKNEQLQKWINKYSDAKLAHFQTILDRFEIDLYRMTDPQPQAKKSTYQKNYL